MKVFLPVVSLVVSSILAVQPVWADPQPAVSADDASRTPPLQVSATSADGIVTPGSRSSKGFMIHISDQAGAPVADAAVLIHLPESGATGTFSDATHAAVSYTDAQGNVQFSGIGWSSEPGVVPVTITATKGAAHAGTILEQHLQSVSPAKTILGDAVAMAPASAAPTSKLQTATPAAAPVTVQQPGAPQLVEPHELATASIPSPAMARLVPAHSDPLTPSVSVVNAPTHQHFDSGSSHKKWIILAVVVAAGAGAGVAMMMAKKSSTSSTPASTTTIGQPTITVSAP